MEEVKLGIYRHFKGNLYKVIGVARNSEAHDEEIVVYQALYQGEFPEGQLWTRPKKMFLERVVRDGVEKPRFEFIREE